MVGALAGQVSTIVGTVITGRRDRTTAQEKRRREAYAVKDIAGQIANLLRYELPQMSHGSLERTTGIARELRNKCDEFVLVARDELK